jgi:hypothetical protein
VGPRASLDDKERLKFLTPQDLSSDPLVVQPIASHYSTYDTMALVIVMYNNEAGRVKTRNVFWKIYYRYNFGVVCQH